MDYSAYPLLAHWLRQPDIGLASLRQLMMIDQSADAVSRWSVAALQAHGLSQKVATIIRAAGAPGQREYREAEWLERHQIRLMSCADKDFPPLLSALASPPPWLFVQGDAGLLQCPQLAIVGSRKPTPAGRSSARLLAASLAECGLTITSGLAIGIDSEAHLGALEGAGRTVAVTGVGPDRIYPHRNRGLVERLLSQGGAVVTEFLPGTAPAPANFPRRNRIISGLSLGVLVIEAAMPSGSLITAQYAAEQGREVLAMPGSVHSPLSRGSNDLLRHGAALVEHAHDVLDALSFHSACRPPEPHDERRAPSKAVAETPVLQAIGLEPTRLAVIVQRTGLSVPEVMSALTALELDGLIEQRGGCAQRTGSALAGLGRGR